MHKIFTRILWILLLTLNVQYLCAQQTDHIQAIQQRLDNATGMIPGLNQKVQLVLTGVSIQQYLGVLSRSNDLSISIDPSLNFVISDTFNGVTAENILLLLAQKYNLDIAVVGTIIYITPYRNPLPQARPREIKIKYTPNGDLLSMELAGDSLPAVARKITEISGKNVIVPGAMQNKLVSAFIRDAPFGVAMEKLAYGNEIKMVRTTDNFYLFQPLGDNEELYVNGDHNTDIRKTFRPSGPAAQPGANGLFVRSQNGQKLISADAVNAPIMDLVKQASQETGKSYSLYSDIKGLITMHISDVNYDTFLDLLFKSTEYTFHIEKGVYLIGDRKLEGLRTFKAVRLQNRAIDTVVAMIPTDWKRGIEIREFRDQNTIILSGSAAQINEVETFIKQLDELVPVVLIEVIMVDVRKTHTVSTGISAGISDSVKTGGTVLSGLNYTFGSKPLNDFLSSISKFTSVNLGHVTPNFYVTLNALDAKNDIEIRSTPKVATLNGHSARLDMGNKRYYKNTTQNLVPFTNSAQTIFTNVFQEVNADLSVNIRPIVSGNDQVTLGITVNNSEFTALPTDGSPPPQSNNKFETSLRVHSDDTIVLGGLERTETDVTASGIPLLSQIPVLKWLFSSRSKTNAKIYTVLFIKSTIIR